MSIFPKIIKREKNKSVTLHMHLENKGGKDIPGDIVFTIINPKNKKKKIREKVIIKRSSKIDKYYKYPIKEDGPIGRYHVDGRFYFGKEYIRSETSKTDFFDVFKK